jgi:hypothetical protein
MDSDSIKPFANRLVPGCWLFPTKWNQDLACLLDFNGNALLRFVQITNSASHGLNLKYVRELAISLISALNRELERIEIVMAIPQDTDLSITQSMVKHTGVLAQWKVKVGNTKDTWCLTHEHELVKIIPLQ